MNKLLALADRVEKLTGPDREVDFAISLFAHSFIASQNPPVDWSDADQRTRFAGMVPFYTESIDKAFKLIPKGWGYGLDYAPSGSGLRFTLGSPDLEPVFVHGDAMTFPCAVVAAALRARAYGGGEG